MEDKLKAELYKYMDATEIKLLKWFAENYEEDEKQCLEIIGETCTKYTCTIQSLYEACVILRRGMKKKCKLRYHTDKLAEISIAGFKAARAGEMLRDYFLVKHIIKS